MRPHTFGAALLALGLLPGCIVESHASFPQHDETRQQEYPNFDGVIVKGTLSGGGKSVDLIVTATNHGPDTYKVSSICVTPWSETLTSSLGEVHRGEPMAHCDAFGLKEFKPGDSDDYKETWNGTLWDSEKEAFVRAPAGKYTWSVAFEMYKGGKESYEYETHDRVPVSFTVTVD